MMQREESAGKRQGYK
jgi:hypothetical protein